MNPVAADLTRLGHFSTVRGFVVTGVAFVDLEGSCPDHPAFRPSGGITDALVDDPFMPLGGWLWGLVAVNAVVFILAIAAAAVLLGRDRDPPPARTTEWYDDAIELTREVTLTANEIQRPADPDRVSRQLLPLSSRIRRHVREAPASVDAEVYRGLFVLAMRCQQVALEHEPVGDSDPLLADRLDLLADDADSVQACIPPI